MRKLFLFVLASCCLGQTTYNQMDGHTTNCEFNWTQSSVCEGTINPVTLYIHEADGSAGSGSHNVSVTGSPATFVSMCWLIESPTLSGGDLEPGDWEVKVQVASFPFPSGPAHWVNTYICEVDDVRCLSVSTLGQITSNIAMTAGVKTVTVTGVSGKASWPADNGVAVCVGINSSGGTQDFNFRTSQTIIHTPGAGIVIFRRIIEGERSAIVLLPVAWVRRRQTVPFLFSWRSRYAA